MFSQVLFYLHKPAFAQALRRYPKEPLKSPWAASVTAVSLETSVYLLAVAKSWIRIDPVLCPQWWHIYFHAFAASVAQSSLVIKSPRSTLAPHAWSQLNEAVQIFDAAGSGGAPVAAFVPRLRILLEKAYLSLQSVISVPRAPGGVEGDAADLAERLAEGTDVSLSILAPPTRLDRTTKARSTVYSISPVVGGPTSVSQAGISPLGGFPRADPAIANTTPDKAAEYMPYDSPIPIFSALDLQLAAASRAAWTPMSAPTLAAPPSAAGRAQYRRHPPAEPGRANSAISSAAPRPSDHDPPTVGQDPPLPPSTVSVPLHPALNSETFATSFPTRRPAQPAFPPTIPPRGNVVPHAADDLIAQFDRGSDGIDWACKCLLSAFILPPISRCTSCTHLPLCISTGFGL